MKPCARDSVILLMATLAIIGAFLQGDGRWLHWLAKPATTVLIDPSFRVKTDEESGQTIISGMGELHLDIIVDRLKREFNVEANVGAPQVAYRETITLADVKSDYKHAKQSGGKGQYGHVVIDRNNDANKNEFVCIFLLNSICNQ